MLGHVGKPNSTSLHTSSSHPLTNNTSPSSIAPTQCSPFPQHTRAHNSSFWLIDTSFVLSIMTTISVWERKKEKKKREEEEAMVRVSLMTTMMMATMM